MFYKTTISSVWFLHVFGTWNCFSCLQGNKKFSVSACSKDTTKCVNGRFNRSKDGEKGLPCALDAIFEQYKNTMKESQDVSAPNDSGETSISVTDNVRTSRKRGLIEG